MDNPSGSDLGVRSKNSAFRYSPSREERIGSSITPYDTSQLPISLTTAIVPSFVPGEILTFDRLIQLPPHLSEYPFIGSFCPGTTTVGQPFPFSQEVPVQGTFPSLPMGAGAPSGASILPGSSFAPPLHLGSPESLNPRPYDPRPGISSVPPGGQGIIQPRPVSASYLSPAGHVQQPGTAPVFHQEGTSAAPPANAHTSESSLKPFLRCPICNTRCSRTQERNRHLTSHLPCWIACSFDACRWRGDRRDIFNKHLWDEHQITTLAGHGYQLYNPKPLVQGIVKGSISIGDAERRAIAEVKKMALVLSNLGVSKQDLLEDPSGRKGKGCSRR